MENNQTEFRCEDELLLQKLIDDELAPDASELVFHHLKGCQSCAEVFHELKDMKALCEGQLGAEDEAEAPFTSAALARVADSLRSLNHTPAQQPVAVKNSGWLDSARSWLRSIDLSLVLQPKVVTGLAAIVIVVGVVYWLKDSRAVSASDLLRRSVAADEAVMSQSNQVLKRAITLETRIGRKSDLSDVSGNSALRRQIEIWQGHHGVVARRMFDENKQLLAGEWGKADGSRTMYQIGAKASVEPAAERQVSTLLSPRSIWLLNISAKEFSDVVGDINSAQVEQTPNSYVIKYTRPTSSAFGLVRASLVISKADLHTSDQTLVISQPDDASASAGIRFIEYKFSETSFERRTPDSVAPAVFEPDAIVLEALKNKPTNGPTIAKSDDEVTQPGEAPTAPTATSNVASSELEVDVLEKLNRVNAFLGEQLSLTRTRDGRLLVSGVVSTAERKNEILRSLGDVARNSAVTIDVSTVAEAQARQKSKSNSNVTLEDVQVAENTLPVDTEVRAFFSRRGLSGDQLENQIEQLSRSVLGHSSRARSHALAAKQIAERFSASDLQSMDAAALMRWRSLIKDHANQFRQELAQVRKDLAPIFANTGIEAGTDVVIGNDQDIAKAAKRLYELSTVIDNGFRSSFSLSSERSDAPVRSQQFWRSVSSGQALATKMANL